MRSFFRLRFWMSTAIALVLLIGISNGAWAAEDKAGAAKAGAKYTGAEYYVSPNGNNSFPGTLQKPWKTLKYAVGKLNSGDTLVLRGGSYKNKDDVVTITRSNVKLKNYAGETPIIDGQFLRPAGFSKRPVKGDSRYPDALWGALIRIAAEKVTIDGLTITKSTGMGINLEPARHTTITNCVVTYNMHVGVRTGFKNKPAYNLVENSTFTNCNYAQDTGVIGRWSNISTAVATTGIGCVVRNNVVAMNPCAGVEGFMDKGTIIENNTIYGNKLTQIHLAKCNQVTIRNNLLFGIKRTGSTTEYGRINNTNGTGAGISIRTETWSDESTWNKGHRIYGNKIANTSPGLHFGVEGNPPKEAMKNQPDHKFWQTQTLDDCKFYNNTIVQPAKNTLFCYAIRIRDDKHVGKGNSFFNNIFWSTNGRLVNFSKEYGVGGKIAFGYNLWNKAPEDGRFRASTDSTASGYPGLNMSDYFSKTSGWNDLDPTEAVSKLTSYFDLRSTAVHAIDKGTNSISGVGPGDFSQTTFGSLGGNSVDIGAGSGGGADSSGGGLPGAELPSSTIEAPVLSIVPNE